MLLYYADNVEGDWGFEVSTKRVVVSAGRRWKAWSQDQTWFLQVRLKDRLFGSMSCKSKRNLKVGCSCVSKGI